MRTVKVGPEDVLRAANLPQSKLHFTIVTAKHLGNRHIQIYKLVLIKTGQLTWDDIRNQLNFRNCAPSCQISVIEGTVHLVFRSTSTESFDKSMEINIKHWLDNQYPEILSSRFAPQAREKIIGEQTQKKDC